MELTKTVEQRKDIKTYMNRNERFNYKETNLYMGLKRSVEKELRASIHRIPLHEFLISTLAGSNYLVADKLADILYRAAQPQDLATLLSADVINGWEGGDLDVDITDRHSLKARRSGSGGSTSPRTPTTSQATLSPVSFNAALISDSSVIEDTPYALVEWHVRQAAYAIAAYSNDLVLDVLKTATDGVGTVNSGATGDLDETKLTGGVTTDVALTLRKLGDDEWVPDTMVTTPESWGHSISMQAQPTGWDNTPPSPGFHNRLGNIDVAFSTSPILHDSTDTRGSAFTECVTVVFDRSAAILTGRKRWMLIEDFVNPMEDLEGAVVSSRQDTVSLYDDAIFVLTET